MTAIYALYDDPVVAQKAVDGLRAAGVADRDIAVMSSEPFEEFAFSQRDSAHWLHWVAGLGGAAGAAGGYWMTAATQQAWPLRTSGMPIVSAWPNLIVIFEVTMLGAMLATVVTLFVTARLGRRVTPMYDPEVTRGYILVGVERPSIEVAAIRQALEAAGPGRLKTIPAEAA